LRRREGAIKARIVVAFGANIGLARDVPASAAERDRGREGPDRLRHAKTVHPLPIGLVHSERLCRARRHAELAPLQGGANGVLNRRPGDFLDCIAAAWKKSIEKNDRADQCGHLFSNAGNNESAIGVTA
jgi:hypothetical protein